MELNNEEEYRPGAKTISQLASEYKVSQTTMRKWLKAAKLHKTVSQGMIYTPLEVKGIYEKFGTPYKD